MSPTPLHADGRRSSDDPADAVPQALRVLREAPFSSPASREQERACEVLLHELLSVLRGAILRYSLDEDEVADALYPRFLDFVTHRVPTIGPTRKDFHAFGYVLGVKALKHVIRARARRQLREVLLPDDVAAVEAADLPRLECVEQMVDTLPAEEQLLVRLKVEGYSGDEIAGRLGGARNAVDQRWHRIKGRLRRACGGQLDV